ncbi:MAG: hypothetical protein EBU90_18700 [Proteobacteria bacterium]|nr:hypothetical protein [Pseudomonadota bacterium]NBP16234.1 hypothetical protein [bacterium]
MNYYSIEFFKFYLKSIKKNKNNLSAVMKSVDKMYEFVKDREKNNEDAYNKKHLKKLVFK